MDVIERARLYVQRMDAAVSGRGGHNATFKVAIALRHGFGLTMNQAWPLMLEYNERCDPRWSHRELTHKLEQVEKVFHKEPRGHLLGQMRTREGREWTGARKEGAKEERPAGPAAVDQRNWRPFDAEALEAEQTSAPVDAEWLWRRSPVDCRSMAAGTFLEHVSAPGDRVLVFNNERTQGQFIFWNHEEERRRGWYSLGDRRGVAAQYAAPPAETPGEIRSARMGVWWLCQPVTGEWRANGEKWSRRSEGNVASWRRMILECDEPGVEQEWLNFLAQLPLPIEALYTSGGRSVHASVRVSLSSKAAWDMLRDFVKPALTRFGADRYVFSAVRLTRLPGCFREGAIGPEDRYVRYPERRLQRLLFLNPAPQSGESILGLPVLRSGAMWAPEGE